jgi:hypothetical protein
MIRPWCNKLGTALLLTACCIFLYMCGCETVDPPEPGDVVVVPADTCPSWDSDCDEISDSVEVNPPNSYLCLSVTRKDANPSIALGSPLDGSIQNAINLVDTNVGYYHFLGTDEDERDDWGTLHLVNLIEAGGRAWDDYYLGVPPRIGVGDLSKGNDATQEFGGSFPPHSSHQNGLDVDVRYIRNDGQETPLNIGNNPEYYDVWKTETLIRCLALYANVQLVYIDSVHAGFYIDGLTRDYPGHSDHFHVRIADPDGTEN